MTDVQWSAITPLVTNVLAKGGRSLKVDPRVMVNVWIKKNE
ncbi:hypothetical protein [Roseiflexus sp.]